MSGPRSRLGRGLAQAHADEAGIVSMIVVVMVVPVLLGAAAIGIDIANWYFIAGKIQATADAAALAGVTHLPTSPPDAFATAQRYATANGWANGQNGTTVHTAVGDKPEQLAVTITATVHNAFGALIGAGEETLTRTATADYAGPLQMGSMCNVLGAEPNPGDGTGSAASGNCVFGRDPKFVINLDFPGAKGGDADTRTTKDWGDRYGSRYCSPGDDGCNGLDNVEHKPAGYFFKVHVGGRQSQVDVQAFDPALVATGSRCENNGTAGTPDQLPTRWPKGNSPNPYVKDAKNRYAGGLATAGTGSTATWCTGDHSGMAGQSGATSFAVRAPGTGPDPLSGPVLCARQFRSVVKTDLTRYLWTGGTNYNTYISSVFRQWVSLCTLTNPTPGDYWIQVRVDLPDSQPNLAAAMNRLTDGGSTATGVNGFSLRAKVTGDPGQVTVSAARSLPLSVNMTGSGTFFLTRIGSDQAGRNLAVSLFDPADVTGATATVRISGPAGSPWSTLNGCTATGVTNGALTNCTVRGMTQAAYNGKIQNYYIPIPADYSCNDTDPTACWFRVTYTYRGGGHVFDATTLDTQLNDDPVRLIR